MPGIIVSPELGVSLVTRRGIVTVPEEMAMVSCGCPHNKPCTGLVIRNLPLPARELELQLTAMGERFIDRMRVRGFDLAGALVLHGPWPSYEFNQRLLDTESEAARRAEQEGDLSYLLPFVFERNAASPYKDYLLVGDFLKQNVLTEVVIKEARDGD